VSSAGDKNDFDSPWKEALEKFLRPFLALCLPTIEAGIDWSQEVVFLDKELQSLQHDAESGRQYVDKLIRVSARDGSESCILMHVEVQAQADTRLPERLYDYHQRLDQIYRRPVVSWRCWPMGIRSIVHTPTPGAIGAGKSSSSFPSANSWICPRNDCSGRAIRLPGSSKPIARR
jgi:hypothetical protein